MKRDHLVVLLFAFVVIGCATGVLYAAIPNNTLKNGYFVIPTINVTTTARFTGPNPITFNTTVIEKDILLYPEQTASYIIFTDGVTYYAKNGITNQVITDTSAEDLINYCIQHLTYGGNIFFKQGIYHLNYTGAFYVGNSKYCINMNQSNVSLFGENNATLRMRSGVNIGGTNVNTDHLAMIWIHADNIRISGLTFDANVAQVTAGMEIPIYHNGASYNVEIDHNSFRRQYWAIYGDGGPEAWKIHDNLIYGVITGAGTVPNGIGIHNAEKQIYIYDNNIGYLSYCTIGIFIDTVSDVIVANNVIRRPGNQGIYVYDDVQNIQIINNQILGKSGGGTVSGIKLESKDSTVSAVNYTLIEGNYFTTLTTAMNNGILIDDAWCYYTDIKNNVFNGPTTAISGTGTYTRIFDNRGYTAAGDIRYNAGNLEMWNSTAWVIIGP